MKVFSSLILILLLCLLQKGTTSENNSTIKKREIAFSMNHFSLPLFKTKEIFKNIYEIWHFVLHNPDTNVQTAVFNRKEHFLTQRFLEVSSKITNIEQNIKTSSEAIVANILQAFPKVLKLELNLHELTLIKNQINFMTDQMITYLTWSQENTSMRGNSRFNPMLSVDSLVNNLNISRLYKKNLGKRISSLITKRQITEENPAFLVKKFTLEDFATWITGHSYNSLPSLLRRMNDLILPEESQNLFEQINEVSQEMKTNICNLRQSPHQTLYNLYNTVAVADLKGNTLLQFSYMLLQLFKKENFTTEAEIVQWNYEKYAKEKVEAIQVALSKADRSIYKCDPNQYVEGVTFTKLKGLLQGYIENEVNLNPYGTCRENCQYYEYTEYNSCFKNQFCAIQAPCTGKVINCRFVESDMNICTSSNPDRRYEWVEYENGKVLGNKGVCEKKNLFKVDSWWRYLFWHCSYCLCICEDINAASDRYFNLRDVTSDIAFNKIVTGLRIVKQNQIIHLQIQQGVLSSLGVVDKTTLLWKPVDDYTIDDLSVTENVDYHAMNWLEKAIDTDDVYAPPEHVVTGVRLRKIGGHLNLEIRVTPINFTSGEVLKEHSYWLGNDNTVANKDSPRTEIVLTNPDIPIRNGPHLLNSKHNQYIEFQISSFETDAGQSIVPYLDSQVLTSQGSVISGIGFIHRGKHKSGGFIAPKLISYDYSHHIKFDKST